MNGKELRIAALLLLDTVFFLLEAIIGYSVHSLALVADSFHMLNDIISLVIAFWAVRVKNAKPADGKYTYGWQRAEILGALINAVFLLALCFTIIIEAIQRFFEPAEISSPKLVLVVGVAGLISNGVGLVLFHEHGHSHGGGGSSHGHEHGHSHGDEEAQNDAVESGFYGSGHAAGSSSNVNDFLPGNVVAQYANESSPLVSKHSHSGSVDEAKPAKKKSMNMEGVFLHVLGDALGNIGVIVTALFIWKTDYSWKYLTDPLVSLLITVIIFSSALPLCRKSSKILLQATPPNINTGKIIESILKLKSVKSVHDFHVWNLNEDILIASLHLEIENSNPGNPAHFDSGSFLRVVGEVREVLHKFGIHSATIQPEITELDAGRAVQKKASAYGQSSKLNCVVDNYSNCDTDQCQ